MHYPKLFTKALIRIAWIAFYFLATFMVWQLFGITLQIYGLYIDYHAFFDIPLLAFFVAVAVTLGLITNRLWRSHNSSLSSRIGYAFLVIFMASLILFGFTAFLQSNSSSFIDGGFIPCWFEYDWKAIPNSNFTYLGILGGPVYKLDLGESGKVNLTFSYNSEGDRAVRIHPYVGLAWHRISPPLSKGLVTEFEPSDFTIEPHTNVSVTLTIKADKGSLVNIYDLYFNCFFSCPPSSKESYWRAKEGFRLMIGGYKPTGSLTVLSSSDMDARDEINITTEISADSYSEVSFLIRSEGAPLSVEAHIVNINVPKSIDLSLPVGIINVEEGHTESVYMLIHAQRFAPSGRYQFKVLVDSGNETHNVYCTIIVRSYIP